MALRIALSGDDLGRVRFAISPVFEVVGGLRALREPGQYPVHLPWVRWARERVPDGPDVALLRRLLAGEAIPVSLLPPPDSRLPDVAHELRRVRAAAPERFAESVSVIFRGAAWTRPVLADPRAALGQAARALDACFDALIAPHWPRMRALLEADIGYRGQQLSADGLAGMLGGLNRDVRWEQSGAVVVWPGEAETVELTGHRLVLCPSILTSCGVSTRLRPDSTTVPLRYPARGAAALWEQPVPPADSLVRLLGATRAHLLAALGKPAATPALARQLGVTPGAVAQHLGVLREAGLAATERTGRDALHLRTARGDALLSPMPG
jgi:DNA-binding transcriptional ArsR family regulator